MRAFWLLVTVPLIVAGYLAVRMSSERAELRRHEVQGLLDGRLADVRVRASQAFAAIERELDSALADAPSSPDELRALGRKLAIARQLFRLDAQGRLTFPTSAEAGRGEHEFLERTASIWTGRAILAPEVGIDATSEHASPRAGSGASDAPGSRRVHSAAGVGDSLVDLAAQRPHGWLSWYWAEGVHVLFWRRTPDRGVIGVELQRIGVLARIVGALPTSSLAEGRMDLVDSRGQIVHQWGPLQSASQLADASIALDAPLDAWQLRYFISPEQRAALADDVELAPLFGIGAVALALIGLAVYVYREYTRRLRDAAARVGFVTRVSHELRTPLTNIRLYAELMEDAALDDDEQTQRARVIVAESERLGRLIDNVLAFARHQKGTLAPTTQRVDVDAVVRGAVAKFGPALDARSIVVKLDLAGSPARANADAIDQIVGNLMSNVERYAATGGEVTVETRAANGHVVVSVADRGPGVAAGDRETIFEPFKRSDEALTATTGTGIGLAIARELARASGGELALADSDCGARFQLTLPAYGGDS
ncbi:MAG TPA: HAMP domain-containing sensor histidine kinase [Kofleriaceae bacterium]